MSKLVSELQTDLAYRLGESASPTNTTELAKRRNWLKKALENTISSGRLYWWRIQRYHDVSVTSKPYYTIPTGCVSMEQLKVNDYEHKKVSFDDVYNKFESPLRPVAILPRFNINKIFYTRNGVYYPLPQPDAPTTYAITSIARTLTVALVTTTLDHGFHIGDFVKIAGITETDYNGEFEVLTVPTTKTFTYTVAGSPSTPATGTTKTVYRMNMDIWGYDDFATELASFTETSSIIIPDNYSDLMVSYAEGRFWSVAHKRGKASDAFSEYADWKDSMDKEQTRRKFGEI